MRAILRLALGLALALPLAVTAQAQQACETIAEQARRYTPPADGTFLFPVQGLDQMTDSVVHLGQRQDPSMQEASKLIDILSTRFRPTRELLEAAQALNQPGGYGTLWQIGRGLHAIEVEGGTAHCAGFLFFAADPNGRATLVGEPPATHSPGEGSMHLCSGVGSEGLVGIVKGEPAFFVQEGMDQDFEIGVTLWSDERWQPECKLSLRFSAAFSIGERFCNGVDCEAAANAGLALAKRFDGNTKLQEQEEAKLSAPEREAFQKLPPFPEKTLPTFGSKAEFHDFGCDEVVLPVKIGGRLYVGRLSHGSIGWRCFNDFVFALYAVTNGEAVPVAGITIDKVRAAPVEATVK
jgi:hypothetical protein